jgi:putative inorganic carbon (HCO3(-)) transporter
MVLVRSATLLTALTGVLLYATVHWGGVVREDRSVYLLALGVIALFAGLLRAGTQGAPRLSAVFRWLLALLPAYIALQIVPLPSSIVSALSPARGQVLAALSPVSGASPYTSLSVFPSGTLQHLLLFGGYVAVFLLVRELMWFFSDRRWILAAPLVLIATWEAALGIMQHGSVANSDVSGNYANRNHFAGLLELTLPFSLAYPLAFFRGNRRRSGIPAPDALKMSASWAIAAVLFVGITFSLSRMGFTSAIFSMLVIGALALLTGLPAGGGASRAMKWAAIGLLVALLLTTFLFLPPDQLVQRFARLSDEGDRVRADLWRETIELVRAYPIFGCGLGGYESAFPKYKVSGPLMTDDFAHDDYLQFLAELGVIGAGILIVLVASTVRAAFRSALSASDPGVWSLALACAGSLGAILLHSVADFNLYIPANAMVVAWVAGIATSLP